jgi:uncharacterized protein
MNCPSSRNDGYRQGHYLYTMANRLINEQSPYLLQHAHNPVDWYPWGDEAFERAKTEHKPVIVSIGYAACHWCHVMEHESFEDEATAAYMNEHFVCIKVDREEHPDVDHLYMDAVQAISGNGGWPLNVFVTPDRAPFYGGTYYPPRPAYSRPSWLQLLGRMNQIWHEQHDEVSRQAQQMTDHLRQASQRAFTITADSADKNTCRKIADNLLQQADREQGGFGNAPKFPGTMAIGYLLEHYHFTGYEPALEHALRSLDAMIEGGIYDQLGGGFARYATDRNWLIPHFEKMLYDNALLIGTLCDAYRITKHERYKEVIEETIAFVERELADESGGYYCALDADSEGHEGRFYTWTWKQWSEVIGPDDAVARQYFGVTAGGNWEATNILSVVTDAADIAAQQGLPVDEVVASIAVAKQRLFAARAHRVRPQTDDKCLLSWNALMNQALVKAGTALDNEAYLVRAEQHISWMMLAYERNGAMMHVWKKGVAKIDAKLDDLAYLIQAMLQLASATGKHEWSIKAMEVNERVVADFCDAGKFFYYTSKHSKDIPVRKIDVYDGATPSANAVMAQNLWLCGMLGGKSTYTEHAGLMLRNMADTSMRYAYSFGQWAVSLQRSIWGMRTVLCIGYQSDKALEYFKHKYLPQAYLVTSPGKIYELPITDGKYFADEMHIFVCTEQVCLSPASGLEEALRLVNQ